MAFPARYEGKCSKCSGPIRKGQFIAWDRTKKGVAWHYDCANPDTVPPSKEVALPASGSLESIKAALAETMAALKRMEEGKTATPESPAPETAIVKVEPKERAKMAHKLKDNAQWHEILQTLCESFPEELIRVLLIGPPGTGKSKTSLVLTNTDYRVTMTEGMGVEDLIGMYQLVKGETVWCDGPVIRAMREGKRILIDEIDHHPTEVGSLLYALLDDNPEIMLPTGEKVVAEKGYGVLATTNSNVTALPEAVLDRFEAVMPAIQPHPTVLAQFDNESMRNAVANHFRSLEVSPWTWSGKPTLRRMRAFARLKPVIGEINAANLAFGTAGRELLGVLTTSSRTSSL